MKVVNALETVGIRYAMVGAYAVSLHGAVRGSVDVDLAIALQKPQYLKLEEALKILGLESRLPVVAEEVFEFRQEYIHKRNLREWNFINPSDSTERVDILITEDADKLKTVDKLIRNQVVKVAAIDELIRMKSKSSRSQDQEDVKALQYLL